MRITRLGILAAATPTVVGVRAQVVATRRRWSGPAWADASSQSPRCFAITIRCTSFVPSPISRIFWSRKSREIGDSSMNP